jgi:hypothetical protein
MLSFHRMTSFLLLVAADVDSTRDEGPKSVLIKIIGLMDTLRKPIPAYKIASKQIKKHAAIALGMKAPWVAPPA